MNYFSRLSTVREPEDFFFNKYSINMFNRSFFCTNLNKFSVINKHISRAYNVDPKYIFGENMAKIGSVV